MVQDCIHLFCKQQVLGSIPSVGSSFRLLSALRLNCRKRHAASLEAGRGRFVLRAGEDVDLVSPTHVDEAGVLQRPFPLCFQQSTGDSPRPEVDVVLRALWHFLVHHDVRYLQATAGP